MSMIDLFKGFHSQAKEEEYPASARLLGYWLIGEFNEAFWAEELRYSEREISGLTGLPPASVHRAIKYLCDRGHLKTWRPKKIKGKTIFKLLGDLVPTEQSRSNTEAETKQTRSTNEALAEQTSAVPIKRVRKELEDVKTKDSKTQEEANAGAREDELGKILDKWERLRFCGLNVEKISKLEVLLKRYGYKEMVATMEECNSNETSGVSLSYFERGLKMRENKKSTQKGGESRGKNSGGIEYREPDYGWLS